MSHRLWAGIALATLLASALFLAGGPERAAAQLSPAATGLPQLKVSANGRFVQGADGSVFFWLGDTAWNMLYLATRAEVETYLANRQARGFTVIMTGVIIPTDQATTGEGCTVMANGDPLQLTPCYLAQVDFVVSKAAELGLYVALMPTSGEAVSTQSSAALFTDQNARAYGKLLATRYRDATNIIWVLGGDSPVANADEQFIWEEMAAGIIEGVVPADPLIFYHPSHFFRQSNYFHTNPNFDLNAWQSGHSARDLSIWDDITADYKLEPAKPVFDSEPNYEDHPVNWGLGSGFFRDYEVRRQVYRSVFAGGFGVTYGNHAVWQWYAPGRKPYFATEYFWYDALNRPGATQMVHLRRLMESRPFFTRIPDQTLLASAEGSGISHVRATRDSAGSYAMVYIPTAQTVRVNLDALTGDTVAAWWYDPRTGVATQAGTFASTGSQSFTPPAGGPDWVLVLDDPGRITNAPGEQLAPPPGEQPNPPPVEQPGSLPPALYIPAISIEGTSR